MRRRYIGCVIHGVVDVFLTEIAEYVIVADGDWYWRVVVVFVPHLHGRVAAGDEHEQRPARREDHHTEGDQRLPTHDQRVLPHQDFQSSHDFSCC